MMFVVAPSNYRIELPAGAGSGRGGGAALVQAPAAAHACVRRTGECLTQPTAIRTMYL